MQKTSNSRSCLKPLLYKGFKFWFSYGFFQKWRCTGLIVKSRRELLAEDIEVRGISYEFRDQTANKFMKGNNQEVRVFWDSDNEWDPNAIQVNGRWVDEDGQSHEGKLGYVPKEIAEEIIEEYGDGMTLNAKLKRVIDPGFPLPKIFIDLELEN